jgi:hypothetical protein
LPPPLEHDPYSYPYIAFLTLSPWSVFGSAIHGRPWLPRPLLVVMLLAWGALLLSTLAAERADAAMTKAELKNAQGESIGTATLEASGSSGAGLLLKCKLTRSLWNE